MGGYILNENILIFDNEQEYNTFESKMQTLRNLPRVGTRLSDGQPQPGKQQTVRYSNPIYHPRNGDDRVITLIDSNADLADNEVEIDRIETMRQNWFPEENDFFFNNLNNKQ